MPIKLADVIENVNSDYPVIDASKDATSGGGIKGFGIFRNFSDRDAVPENKRCYGYVAVVLYGDKIYNEVSAFDSTLDVDDEPTTSTSSPEYDFNADGTYAATDFTEVVGLTGTVITGSEQFYGFDTSTRIFVYKTKPFGLDHSSGGASAVLGGGSENVSVTDEDINSAIELDDWESEDNWVEIGLAANAYPTVPGQDLQDDAEDYRLPIYDTGDKRNKAMSFDDFLGSILQQMIQAVVEAGLGTETTYTNPDNGVIGDFDGDGIVGSADLIIFLGGFGSNLGDPTGNLSLSTSSYVISSSGLTDPTNAVEMIQTAYQNDDWATAGGPDATDLQSGSTDYQTEFFFTAANGTPGVGAWDVFESIGATSSNRSFFGFEYAGGASDPTFQDGLVKIKLSAFTVIGFTRILQGNHNLGFIARVRLKNSSGTVLQTKYFNWVVNCPTTAISGGFTEAFDARPNQEPLTLVDFANQNEFGDTDVGVANNVISATTRIEIEYDYYVPDAPSAVFYLLNLSVTAKCEQG
jgi:hypothetical protein